MKGHIKAEILHRLCYNSKLVANKASASGGATLWIYGAMGLRVASSDDYVVLTDSAIEVDSYSGTPGYYRMEPDALADLEVLLRDSDSDFDLLDLPVTPQGDSLSELYEMEQMAWDVDHWEAVPVPAFAVRADRLQKFSLIKPKQAPVDMKAFASPEGDVVVGFKCGPTVRGLIAPLNRDTLIELGLEEGMWT